MAVDRFQWELDRYLDVLETKGYWGYWQDLEVTCVRMGDDTGVGGVQA